jgi:hypothetical protein
MLFGAVGGVLLEFVAAYLHLGAVLITPYNDNDKTTIVGLIIAGIAALPAGIITGWLIGKNYTYQFNP